MLLVILATAALALALAAALLPRRRPAATSTVTPLPPPAVPGLPWLGSAISLGLHGAGFLSSCKRKYGDAFTVTAAGQRLTFLFAPAALERFFRAPEDQLSFLPAVEQWTWRVFRLPPHDFIPRHSAILRAMRAAVGARGTLEGHAKSLLPLLERGIDKWVEKEENKIELSGAVAVVIFGASVESLFGAAFLQRHGTETLRTAFFAFEGGFELAASPLPQALQPRFRAARNTLLSALAASLAAGDFKDTVVGGLIDGTGMPHSAASHMLLAVLWASQANTVPTAFWALGFLLLPENRRYADQIRHEILQGESLEAPGAAARLIAAACDPSSLLTRCCMEAIRLRASSTDVRIAAHDLILPCDDTGGGTSGTSGGVLIKKGSMVVLCPWISHTDPRIYPEEPCAFNPDRPGAALPGGRRLNSPAAGVGGVAGVAFGGGRFRCPGRGFAEVELGLIVGLVLAALEVKLVPTAARAGAGGKKERRRVPPPGDPGGLLPPPELRKLVGVKVPESASCWVRVRRRERAAQRRRSVRLKERM